MSIVLRAHVRRICRKHYSGAGPKNGQLWSPLLLPQTNVLSKTLRNRSWRPPLPFIYLLIPGHTGGPSVGPRDLLSHAPGPLHVLSSV